MKKIIYMCLGLTVVLLICLFLPKTKAESNDRATKTNSEITGYTVKEYEGQIAVFTDDSDLPVKIYDTSVSSLPECDRELLQLGIPAATPEELQKIIEDFTG